MEKAFYPRNDTVNAVVSNLLPRDGKEDILEDQNGDPVYLQRSSILDGTEIRGFGYCDGHPYKWKVEVESAMKSLVVVPDRFFSIYGKSYPIKRMQTVGINQPSEAFKYEIIYLRGYDKYDDEKINARIIYHRQYEQDLNPMVCSTDEEALDILNNFNDYPYLKLRVCMDGSIRAYLGKKEVGWDYTRQIDETIANAAAVNQYWVEIPQINTEQFRGIDLWVKFDSINALAYYIITKYEDNIFNISPKIIKNGLENIKRSSIEETITDEGIIYTVQAGKYELKVSNIDLYFRGTDPRGPMNAILVSPEKTSANGDLKDPWLNAYRDCTITLDNSYSIKADSATDAIIKCFLADSGYGTISNKVWSYETETVPASTSKIVTLTANEDVPMTSAEKEGDTEILPADTRRSIYAIKIGEVEDTQIEGDYVFIHEEWYFRISDPFEVGTTPVLTNAFATEISSKVLSAGVELNVDDVVGKDYDLETPEDLDESDPCTPCCKKSNLSRAIWAYINPRTMTPYDDDYWFHQGEPYYKKSLTLSTKNNPLKAQRIFVEQGTFPGMYKIVGETFIRNRDTGKDERVQLTFPLCKIKSDQTLTLQADGDPTTFNLDVEVAVPQNGIPMEITFYEVEKEMKAGCSGNMIEKDGSTRIVSG